MQSDDPPFLCLGTEVSAKFKGAFCEAKVKKLVKSIRCKVNLGSEHGTVIVEDKEIKGTIILNGSVDVMQGKHLRSGIIQHIKDCSQYTVVFNDGDERNLRRTQVCLKSGRHFEPEVSLDSLPLYNPEHFSNPVMHGNKKRNRQLSVERTPRKRKTKEDDEEEEDDDVEKRKKRRAASVAAAAMADQGGSTESGEEKEEEGESGDESEREREKEREKSEKKKKVDKMKTPEGTPAKKRKEEKDEERKKKEREKEEERRKKEKEEKKKEKEEVKKKEKKEKEEEKRKDEKKEKKEKKEERVEKEEKKSKTEEKTEKVKSKDGSPRKDKEREKDKPESSIKMKDRTGMEEQLKKPGVAVVVAMRKDRETTKYYPALTTTINAYEKYCPVDKRKDLEEGQMIVKSFVSDGYVRVSISNCVLFESFNVDDFNNDKMTSRMKSAIALATLWNKKKRLPKEWKLAEIFGDEDARKMEKEKMRRRKEEEKRKEREEERKSEEEKKQKEKEEGKKRVEEEERKRKEEEERKKKEKEDEKMEKEREREKKEKEKEKEKDKKTKKPVEVEESASEESESSEDDEADNQERDIFTAQLYKFHEERNTPINKAPVWGGKDLDLHKLYLYVIRYGGSKKCTDSSLWKKILMKLKLGDTGAQPVNVKKAYLRYLNEFHSTYSQLGWSLDDLSTKIVSGGRSAKKVIDYGFRRKRRERTDKGQTKRGEKDESIRSEETGENDDEGETRVKKEEEESFRPMDVSSNETNSRRSLSRITHSESPMPSTSTPAKRNRKGKGSKEESVVRTVSECTEPALTPAVGDDTFSTMSSSLGAVFAPSSPSPTPRETTAWAHDDVKDEYMPANILTHFYQGMSVRALHSGQWYAARVVKVHQPSIKMITDAIDRAVGGEVKREPDEEFELTSLDELREMSKKIRCYVHYLGWNSRYDEYMKLPQIRISQKDEDASMKLARPRMEEGLMEWVSKWSRTREGMSALCGPLESPKDSTIVQGGVAMGGYRPRRVSFSQYEQLSTCATSPMGAVSPSVSPAIRERKESRNEVGEKMSEEREDEKKEEQLETRSSVTPVEEKKEKKKSTKKEEKEYKGDEKEAKGEKEIHVEKKEIREEEDNNSKNIKSIRRTPSPSKLPPLISTSSSVDAAPAAPAASPVPPAAPPMAAAAPSGSAAVTAIAPSTSAAEEKEVEKKGCSISDTIDEVVLLLGTRAEKEKKEREERERREQREAERARKEKEAVVALIATVAAKQKADEEAAGVSKEKEEDEPSTAIAERSKEEEKAKKEVRFEKAERKRGGKDREREPEVKTKKKKDDDKLKKTSGIRVEKKKEEDEMEEETMEEENEELRLCKEAQSLGIPLPDLPGEPSTSGEEKKEEEKTGVSAREDAEEKYQSDSSAKTISTTIDKSAPPSTGKGKKRKKKGNQSNMVLDRKYSKKSKKDEEDDSDEEDAAILSLRPPHASLSVLKTRMLKAMEADGSLRDFAPIGLPHITHSNLYGEKVVCNWTQLEKHAEELREYYYGVRAELAKLEKRNKATIKRRIEKDRAEREVRKAAKEAAAAAAAAAAASAPSTSAAAAVSSTSAAIAALNAEI